MCCISSASFRLQRDTSQALKGTVAYCSIGPTVSHFHNAVKGSEVCNQCLTTNSQVSSLRKRLIALVLAAGTFQINILPSPLNYSNGYGSLLLFAIKKKKV